MKHSSGGPGYGYGTCGRKNPRTVPVIHDAGDVFIYYLDSSDGTGPPFVSVWEQGDDGQLAIDLCDGEPPGHGLAFIVPEVWRFVEGSGKAIGYAEPRVGSDEFAESVPIALVEPVDVEMQEP